MPLKKPQHRPAMLWSPASCEAVQAYPRCRVPAAPLADALLMKISALLPGLLRPPERPPGLGSFLFFALPRQFPLTPGMRAHYPLKGCRKYPEYGGFEIRRDV